MKATGIVRRIDDLGRVVVPKEIRRVLRIREGDPLEIYTGGEGEVILTKRIPPISAIATIIPEQMLLSEMRLITDAVQYARRPKKIYCANNAIVFLTNRSEI